jgi:hypothetical protein
MVTARIPVRALAARRKGSWLLVDIGHCFQDLAKPGTTGSGIARAAKLGGRKEEDATDATAGAER